jgi:formylglycine-generating enzyme required for sulfatase activity
MVARAAARLAASTLLAGCAAAPLGVEPGALQLQIDNPEQLPLAVDAVVGDELREIVRPGSAASIRLTLLPGAYVVRSLGSDPAVAVPAPLFAAALPEGSTLRVRIEAPPATARTDPDFAFVPAGPAVIGDTLGIGQEDERPARIALVPAFWLGRCEVTNAEYAAFLNAVAPVVDPRWLAFDSRKCLVTRDAAAGTWTTTEPKLPVVTVSLAGATAYCEWRTRATGVRHRLPTEVEWEKAARGPASFVFAYGNVYRRHAANQESGALRAVAQHARDGFGLHDLTGNAFEWTSDPWRPGPGNIAAPEGFQVLRGGSFVLDGVYLRNSFRMRQRPDVRTDDIGFRVARDCTEGQGATR